MISRLFSCYYKYFTNRERVKYYNFWGNHSDKNLFWMTQFIRHRQLNPKKKPIFFYSVFGDAEKVKKKIGGGGKNGVKIFYTAENVDVNHPKYQGNLLPYVDVSCGFDYVEAYNYIRFPGWLITMFPPTVCRKGIREIISAINNPTHRLYTERNRFCALIASHNGILDKVGVRKILYDGVSVIDRIDCPGKLLHNTDSLHKEFKDDKIAFLRKYKFNICPENSNTKGYVTEKIIDSFLGGCIPIYWGSEGYIEPNIINPKSYLYFDRHNLLSLQEKVITLHTDRAYYEAFCRHSPFLPDAADIIYEKFFLPLEGKLKRIFI